jgi:hypothetical protein
MMNLPSKPLTRGNNSGLRWHIRRAQGRPSTGKFTGFDKSFQQPQKRHPTIRREYSNSQMKFTPEDQKLIVYDKEMNDCPQTPRERNQS